MPRPLVKIVLIVGVCLILLATAVGIWLWSGWGFIVESSYEAAVRSIEQIEELPSDITSLYVVSGGDDEARALAPYQKLTSLLFIANSKLSDQGISEFAKLEKLRELDIGGSRSNNISGIGFNALINLKFLKHLRIESMNGFTDEGMLQLKNLENLSSLRISGASKVTDKGISQLKGMKDLSSLTIYRFPKITNEGILQLKDIENLSSLTIGQCPKVTLDVIEELKKSKPNMYVSITPQEEEAEEALNNASK